MTFVVINGHFLCYILKVVYGVFYMPLSPKNHKKTKTNVSSGDILPGN